MIACAIWMEQAPRPAHDPAGKLHYQLFSIRAARITGNDGAVSDQSAQPPRHDEPPPVREHPTRCVRTHLPEARGRNRARRHVPDMAKATPLESTRVSRQSETPSQGCDRENRAWTLLDSWADVTEPSASAAIMTTLKIEQNLGRITMADVH